VPMVRVVRNGQVVRRQCRHIDQLMVVPGVWCGDAGGCYAHAA
jgi:hypothetical protein